MNALCETCMEGDCDLDGPGKDCYYPMTRPKKIKIRTKPYSVLYVNCLKKKIEKILYDIGTIKGKVYRSDGRLHPTGIFGNHVMMGFEEENVMPMSLPQLREYVITELEKIK